MHNELSGKIALVTGGSRGIGRATVLRLARSGADIALNFVSNESAAREVAQEVQSLGREILLIKADVSEEEDIESMMDAVANRWGRLNIVVSNAAGGGFRELQHANSRHFDMAMHTNVRPLMLLTQKALPLFAKNEGTNCKVVALSSHGSHRALPHYGLIGASKAAIESLIRHMAAEYGPQGINFNCVLAGLVATDSTTGFVGAEALHQESNASMLVGAGKELLPEHVAEAVHFLCTPASDLIQGHTLIIDGGVSLRL
jgi:enoyl-[acyl-carrier protein] reductase III